MKRVAAVAVIGGGVIGASVAFQLARRGVRDVVIVDRSAAPGEGSTGKATGGFRAQFATPINVRLSLLARERLLRFRDEIGVDPGYEQSGYLWLASSEEDLAALRAAQEMQKREGLHEATELSVADVAAVNPFVSLAGVAGAAFCPTDGFIRPLQMLNGYLTAAQRLGVRVEWSTQCVGMTRDNNGRVKGIQTPAGEIEVESVVNAGGAWAARIAAMAGVLLPVVPLRRQAAVTVPFSAIPASMAMTIFMDTNFHFRMRDGRALLCQPTEVAPGEPATLEADPEWIDSVTAIARERVPVLRSVDVDRTLCYAGLYEMSPDKHVILGVAPECENLYLVNGSSGHGVMHSPILGEIVADLVCGRVPELDVHELRPSRFDEGEPIGDSELL